MHARMSLGTLDISRPPLQHAPESDTRRRTPDQGASGIPDVFNIHTGSGLTENLQTPGPVSNGDGAGAAMGVVSNTITGPDRQILGSAKSMVGATPSTRLTSPTGQSGLTGQSGNQSWRPFAQFRPTISD